MTVAEFREWQPGGASGRRWQLVDGEPVAMAPASENHGAIQIELGALLRNHLRAQGGRCRVIGEAGIVPRLRADENWRVPDLAVTCAPPAGTVEVPSPVLLIEILSPNNHAQTRANVWTYTTLPSVQEIVVVHSTRIEAELLRRAPDGTWPEQAEVLRGADTLRLDCVGFAIPVAELYATTSLVT